MNFSWVGQEVVGLEKNQELENAPVPTGGVKKAPKSNSVWVGHECMSVGWKISLVSNPSNQYSEAGSELTPLT
jgi:hypothetical protein